MRVELKDLPPGKKVRVRCPHCRTIGQIPVPRRPLDSPPYPGPKAGEGRRLSAPTGRGEEKSIASVRGSSRALDPSLPEDAFDDFRFPAEEGKAAPRGRALGMGLKVLVWVGASLGIVLFFALLVNLVLPGPPR